MGPVGANGAHARRLAGTTVGHRESQVPFSDAGGVIAVLLEQRRHRQPIGGDQGLGIAVQDPALQPRAPSIASGQQAVPRRSTHRRSTVGVGECHPLRRQPVQMGRLDLATLRIQALDVAIPEVVGNDVDDIRWDVLLGAHGTARVPEYE